MKETVLEQYNLWDNIIKTGNYIVNDVCLWCGLSDKGKDTIKNIWGDRAKNKGIIIGCNHK